MPINKKTLTEQEIRTQFITPAIQQAGWAPEQIREEWTFTQGRIRSWPDVREYSRL